MIYIYGYEKCGFDVTRSLFDKKATRYMGMK
jgi:hypothetical protein